MARPHRTFPVGVVIACLVGSPWSNTLLASGPAPPSGVPAAAASLLNSQSAAQLATASTATTVTSRDEAADTTQVPDLLSTPLERSPFAVNDGVLLPKPGQAAGAQDWTWSHQTADSGQWGGRYRHGLAGHNDASRTAIILGSIGVIAGTAVLVYANQPECREFPDAGGCGYGTKVVGGAVLAGGAVSLAVGAVTWR